MTAGTVRSAALLVEAEHLQRTAGPRVGGYWARATAFLARAALESAITVAVSALDPALERATMRSKLLLLPLVADEPTAAAADRAWSGLSRACHQHPYELAPTLSELNALVGDVRGVLSRLPH